MSTTWQCWAKRSTSATTQAAPGKTVPHCLTAVYSFEQTFDRYFGASNEQERQQAASDIQLKVPTEVARILSELRGSEGEEARWIAFSLLSLTDNSLDAIEQLVRAARENMPPLGTFRSMVHEEGDVVITVTFARRARFEELQRRTAARAMAEKYKRKKINAIGLGFTEASGHAFETCAWINAPWRHDESLEALVRETMPASFQGKRPGRNEPCVCGSGKKFKRCCGRFK